MKVELGYLKLSVFSSKFKGNLRDFLMIQTEIRDSAGQYLSELINTELSHLLGRERYERCMFPTRFPQIGIRQLLQISSAQKLVPYSIIPIVTCPDISRA